MASSPSPPIIPISTTAAAAPQSPAIRQFIARAAESARQSLSNRRPWSELLDRSAFSRPDNLSEACSRLRNNLAYFRVNYLVAVAAVLALSLLTHPSSLLLLLALLAAWALLYLFRPSDAPPLVLLGRRLSHRETLLALLLLSFLLLFLTSVASILMSALTVAAAAVAAHGAFRVPEDLFLDGHDPGGPAAGIFLSFLGGAASNVSAAAGPAVVAARV